MVLSDHIRDELADECYVVDCVLFGVAAAAPGIPRQKPFEPSTAIRIDNDKAVSLRSLGESTKALHLFPISPAAVKRNHERGIGDCRLFRAMDKKAARGWADGKGVLLGIGVVMRCFTSGKKDYQQYQKELVCDGHGLAI